MPLWGKTDVASNSVISAPAQVRQAPNTTNRDTLYGNTTANGYGTGETIGMFGVDSTEMGVGSGNVASIVITYAGSGYTANGTVSFSGGGGSSAAANATQNTTTGKIQIVNITAPGSSYETNPTVTISAPSAITFNANTALYQNVSFYSNTSGVANTTEFITTTASHGFSNGDRVVYLVPASNTAVSGLTNAASYYIVNANTTAFKLSLTVGGSAVDITSDANNETHVLQRRDFVEIASNILQNTDPVTYTTAAGNTVISGLANNTTYYAIDANSSGVYLASTPNGSRITLVPGATETGHSLTGATATAVATVGGATNKGVVHAGWVLRTEGTGGRAGRVQYETLVAMRNITSDGSDDEILPDA